MKAWLLLAFLLGGGATVARCASDSQPWHEPAHKVRAWIRLPASERPVTAGVVFRGADFYRWTGYPRPAVGSLRLHGPDGPIALQVEELDATGRLVSQGDGRLDDGDRVCFAARLGPRPVRLWLYYDGPAAEPPPGAPSVTVKEQPKDFFSLVLACGQLAVGLHGGGTGAGVHAMDNFGRGALALCTWQGQTIADPRGNWNNYLPRSIASSQDAPPWSSPAVVVHGPVRTVVRMQCPDYRRVKDGKELFRGEVTHFIALWNACPVIDLEEVVDYTSHEFTGTWPYSYQFPVGKAQDENDRLVVTLAGEARIVKLGQTKEEVAKKPWRVLYATDNPEEGWFACQDTAEKTGLATFYEPMETIAFRGAWVTYRPALHPNVSIRTTPGSTLDVRLEFKDRALRCRSRYERQIRYAFLRDETPSDLRTLYHLWGKPLDAAMDGT